MGVVTAVGEERISQIVSTHDLNQRLRSVHLVDDVLAAAIVAERADGVGWDLIGEALGVDPDRAREQWAPTVTRWDADLARAAGPAQPTRTTICPTSSPARPRCAPASWRRGDGGRRHGQRAGDGVRSATGGWIGVATVLIATTNDGTFKADDCQWPARALWG